MKTKEEVISIINKTLQEFPVIEAYLFGSYSITPETAQDIDIGVVMKDKSLFFDLYSHLIKELDFEVDLVPLHDENTFTNLVKRDGVKIYG
jgi:predicted nucleotidyltransferase